MWYMDVAWPRLFTVSSATCTALRALGPECFAPFMICLNTCLNCTRVKCGLEMRRQLTAKDGVNSDMSIVARECSALVKQWFSSK